MTKNDIFEWLYDNAFVDKRFKTRDELLCAFVTVI